MTVLAVCQQVCPVIGLTVPSQVYSSTERQHVELAALANEMAARIAKAHEWQTFATIATITGNGTTEDWSLPEDYDRMPQKAELWSSSLQAPLSHEPDLDKWLGLDVRNFDFVQNAWTIYGDQIHIKPALASGVTAKYFYQSNLVVTAAGGGTASSFVADGDAFRLSERLLRLGMIWQWRENKGLPYAEDMDNYEAAKEKLIAADKGSRKITVGRGRWPRGVQIAYPVAIVP